MKAQLTTDQINEIITGLEKSMLLKKAEMNGKLKAHGAGYMLENDQDFKDIQELGQQISFWKNQI